MLHNSQILKDNIRLHTHHNCIYSQDDYLKLTVYSSIYQSCAEGSSIQLKDDTQDRVYQKYPELLQRCPAGDTWLYHLKKFTMPELSAMNNAITADIIKRARRTGRLKRKVIVAIDFTDVPFYGQRDTPMVVSKKPERGTGYCYKYATSCVVTAGQRFTLSTIPVDKTISATTIVERLVTDAKKMVSIDCLLLDRGFYSVNTISAIKKLDCKYIMPAPMNPRVKHLLRINKAPAVVRYRIGTESNNTYTNLVITFRDDGTKMGFFTNAESPTEVAAIYAKRWGIETSYKKIKHDFLAKTTSKNPIVRSFYFFLAVDLYNLWQLARNVISPSKGWRFLKNQVRASVFGKKLLKAIDVMNTGPPNSRYTQPLGSHPSRWSQRRLRHFTSFT